MVIKIYFDSSLRRKKEQSKFCLRFGKLQNQLNIPTIGQCKHPD